MRLADIHKAQKPTELTGSSSSEVSRPWSECHANHGIVENYFRIPSCPEHILVTELSLFLAWFPFSPLCFLITLRLPRFVLPEITRKVFRQLSFIFYFVLSSFLPSFTDSFKSCGYLRPYFLVWLSNLSAYEQRTGAAKSWSFRLPLTKAAFIMWCQHITINFVRYFIKANVCFMLPEDVYVPALL